MVAAGKEGKIYVIDRDNLGQFDATNDDVLNAVPDGSGHNTPPVQISGSLSTPAYFNSTIYWVSGYNGAAYAYKINANGTLSVTSQTTATIGYVPGSVVVSANGTNNGIVWVMDRATNEIHAYDATTLATELWNSDQAAGGTDDTRGGARLRHAHRGQRRGVRRHRQQPGDLRPEGTRQRRARGPDSGGDDAVRLVDQPDLDRHDRPAQHGHRLFDRRLDRQHDFHAGHHRAGRRDIARDRRPAAAHEILLPHSRLQQPGEFAVLQRGDGHHHQPVRPH